MLTNLGGALEELLKVMREQLEYTKKIHWEAERARKIQETIRHAVTAPTLDSVAAFAAKKQLGFIETVEHIRDNELSFARFGDGEMRMMLQADYRLTFQANSGKLADALRAVLTQTPGLLLGFPHVYRDLHWSAVWCSVWGQIEPMVAGFDVMGNSHVTRPIFFQTVGQGGVDAWRSVWAGKTVTVVTGEGSRFELIPELFDNLAAARYRYSKPVSAFEDVPRVMAELTQDDSDIILVALGPAGTVLASQLAKAGRRALDIGHISDSYENVFQNGTWPEHKAITA